MEKRFVCGECSNVFDKTIPEDSCSIVEIRCPSCDSQAISETPPWAPLGSGLNIFSGDEWAYECKQCNYKFRLSIPKSPDENNKRRCPKCRSNDLLVITGSNSLPLYCG